MPILNTNKRHAVFSESPERYNAIRVCTQSQDSSEKTKLCHSYIQLCQLAHQDVVSLNAALPREAEVMIAELADHACCKHAHFMTNGL